MSTWTLIAADRALATNIAELGEARDIQISFGLSRPATLTFTLPLRNSLADTILDGSVLIKAYQTLPDGTIQHRYNGEIVAVDEQGPQDGTQTIQVETMCAGSFRLQNRLVGKSTTGYSIITPTDRGQIATNILNLVNATTGTDGGGSTGVITGSIGTSSYTTVNPGWTYKPALEAIMELGNALDGYDWQILPLEGTGTGTTRNIGELTINSALGTTREIIFEYGDGQNNVREYSRQVTRQGIATTIYALPDGYTDTTYGSVTIANSQATPLTGYERFEAVLSSASTNNELRQSQALLAAEIRSQPREIINFTPALNSIEYGQDLSIGDVITIRSKIEQDTRIDALVRVYNIDISIDTDGHETIALTLTPES